MESWVVVDASLVSNGVAAPPARGVTVTVYLSMAFPPLLAGAAHDTDNVPLPGVTDSEFGAVGTVRGVCVSVACAPSPAALLANSTTSYAVPFVNPVNESDVASGAS